MRRYSNLSKRFQVRSRSSDLSLSDLAFRYESVPIVIVFTQYDRLVRTKRAELKEDYPNMDGHNLDNRSVEEAWKAFERCLESLRHTMRRLNVQMPPYARVSGTFASLQYLVLTVTSSSGTSKEYFGTCGSHWKSRK